MQISWLVSLMVGRDFDITFFVIEKWHREKLTQFFVVSGLDKYGKNQWMEFNPLMPGGNKKVRQKGLV